MIGILESLFGETSVYKPPDHDNAANTQSFRDSVDSRKYVTEKDILKTPNLENKFYVGHIQYSEMIYTCIKDVPKILLVRDPRDCIVSMYHYLNHPLAIIDEEYKALPSREVKMSATILGMRKGFNSMFFSVNELFDNYFIRWIGSPKSTIIRFEDILGSEFGGEDARAMDTFQTIINLTPLRLRFDGDTLQNKIRVGSDPHKSATFRPSKRKIGTWKEEFTNDHIQLFKLAAPSLVSVLGYEKNENWDLTSSALEYSREINEPRLSSLLSENRDYESINTRYEKMMEKIVFPSTYFRELSELVNDWALRLLLELKAKFTATLTAEDELPPRSTNATGAFELELSRDGKISNYKLSVRNVSNITFVRMHQGEKGTNGPVIMTLYKSTNPKGQKSGLLLEGRIYSDQLEGPLAGKYISNLNRLIREGQVYINVYTTQFSEGEIRGHLLNTTIEWLKYHKLPEDLLRP
jgi:hypothetical protein